MGTDRDFSFRKRFEIQGGALLPFEEHDLRIHQQNGVSVVLRSLEDAPLNEARSVAIWGSGYPDDENSAIAEGDLWSRRVQRALGALGVAANFGHRAHRMGGFTEAGLLAWNADTDGILMNDSWDVLTFETASHPRFIRAQAEGVARVHPTVARAAIDGVAGLTRPGPDQTAVHLYAAAARASDVADSRLVLLVAALESLIDRPERSAASITHIERLAKMTRQDESLPPDERQALSNGIAGMRRVSSRSAALAAADTVAEWPFSMSPRRLVARAFELRHAIVHGGVRANIHEVGIVAAELQALVGELIAGEDVMAKVREQRHTLTAASKSAEMQ